MKKIVYGLFALAAIFTGQAAQVVGYDAGARNPALPTQAGLGWRSFANKEMVHKGNFLDQENTSSEYGYFATPESLPAGTINVGVADYGISVTVQPLTDLPFTGGSDYANVLLEWQDEESYYSITFVRQYGVTYGPSGGGLFTVDWSRPRTIFVGYNHGADTFSLFLDGSLMATVARTELINGQNFIGPNQMCFGDATTGGPATRTRWYSAGVFDRAVPSPVAVPLVEYDVARDQRTPDLAEEAWEFKGHYPMVKDSSGLWQDTVFLAPGNSYGSYMSPGIYNLMRAGDGQYGIEFRVRPLSDMLEAGSSYYANLMVVWGDEQNTYRVSIDRNYPSAESSTGALLGNGDAMVKIVDGIDWSQPRTVYIGYSGEQNAFDFYIDNQWVKRVPAGELGGDLSFDSRFTHKVGFGDFTSGQSAPANVDLKAQWETVSLYNRAAKNPERVVFQAAKSAGNSPSAMFPAWTHFGSTMVNNGQYLLQDTTSLAPGNGYGNFVSPAVGNVMFAGARDYAVVFRVKPLNDLLVGGFSYYANLMVAWSDYRRTYCFSIDKNYPDASSPTGALLGNGDYMGSIVEGIDWSVPRTILIGYTEATDQFHIYVDNQWRKTVTAASISAGLSYQPSWYQRVAFGDFTSGQTAPNNKDLKAEWWSVGIYDWQKEPPLETEDPDGTTLLGFSQLGTVQQDVIRSGLAPPPLSARTNPYSSAMYYPMWGLTNAGVPVPGSSPDGQYHPEWQEALIENWALLGMKNLHVNVFPDGLGTPTRNYVLSNSTRIGLANVASLASRYGMRVILRADPPGTASGYWPANPRNPSNELDDYLGWLKDVIDAMSGRVYAVIPGDEIAENNRVPGQEWSLDDFRQFVIRVAEGLSGSYPDVILSTPSFGTGSWAAVLSLFSGPEGLGNYAGAVAINLEETAVAGQYKDELLANAETQSLELFANGTGYISSVAPRNPSWEIGYYPYNETDHAGMIALSLYHCWAGGMNHAPYYTVLRNFGYQGQVDPLYYGFFGFMDLKISQSGEAEVVAHPGWCAFQTVASAFYDQEAFEQPEFSIRATGKRVAFLAGHERKDGRELLLFAVGEGITDIVIDSDKFSMAVKVDLFDQENWTDVVATRGDNGITLRSVRLQGQRTPVIIRVISDGYEDWLPAGPGEAGAVPLLLGAVSRMEHGAVGQWDIPLPLTGHPATETRRNAESAFSIVLTFDQPIVSAVPFLHAALGTLSGTSIEGRTMTIGISGAANAQTALLEVKGVEGGEGAIADPYYLYFKLLQGDVNEDGIVDRDDVDAIKTRLSPEFDPSSARYDINGSGAVNTGDVLKAKTLIGTSVP